MTDDQKTIIEKVSALVRTRMEGESSGHDWWHIYRIHNTAKHIGYKEKADLFEVELTALLHDIADWKFADSDEYAGSREAYRILQGYNLGSVLVGRIGQSIDNISFKGTGADRPMSLAGQVVQDADRLDAIGAIGIARAFAYGGHSGELMYDPSIKPNLHKSKATHMASNGQGTVINHFYEKLLRLRELMNTAEAQRLAEERHRYMENFLQTFYAEWEGHN